MKITKNNYLIFSELCKKLNFCSKNSKPILVKNPYDFSNFLLIKKLYPDARFVFIHRQPLKVLSSHIKAVQLIFSNKNWYTSKIFHLYNVIYNNLLLLFLTRSVYDKLPIFGMMYLLFQMKYSTKYYMNNIKFLERKDFIEISYKSLCNNANENINSILKFLNLPFNSDIDFQTGIKMRDLKLHPIVHKFQKLIKIGLKDYINYLDHL
jgi:hypothetical protein